MTFIISRLCRDCRDQICVAECPVNCIVEHVAAGAASDLPNQLFIDPEACIDCGGCEPGCPQEAIYSERELPEHFAADAALGALVAGRRAEFRVPD